VLVKGVVRELYFFIREMQEKMKFFNLAEIFAKMCLQFICLMNFSVKTFSLKQKQSQDQLLL
jgi:hypothetical protein